MAGQTNRPAVRLSVRAVVEYTLHESDLSAAADAARRMREGAIAHRARQSGEAELDGAYRAEVALSGEYEGEALTLRVSGRADGITVREDGVTVIEEIKLGLPDHPLVPAHMAQAAMYGHMLCTAERQEKVLLRVLYVDTLGRRVQNYEELRDAASLREAFEKLCAAACAWETEKLARRQARDASLAALSFPFADYRAGQRRFAQNVYVAIRDRKRLFAQAPTGIGKTMAALYPALVALREGRCARVLFLTARVTGRRSAADAVRRLESCGAKVLAAELTARDKVCLQEIRDCRPESCPYAKGFYDRLPGALLDAVHGGGLYDTARIAEMARKHGICPFELSLELARLSDVVIGDYNYVYDPFVAIDALLQGTGGACLLVDEAHQLAPRVRDTLSASVSLEALRDIRRETGKAHGRRCALYKALTGAMAALKELASQPEFESGTLDNLPEALCAAVQAVLSCAGEQLALDGSTAASDAFSLSAAFCFAAEKFNDRYALLTEGTEKNGALYIQCLDASPEILAASKRARGTAYFSATLTPFDAVRQMLGSEEGDACLALTSPFAPAQLDARIAPIDIRYASREHTAQQVAEAIAQHLRERAGNTIVFFPSYAYMARIYELVLGTDGLTDIVFAQEVRGMAEQEKNALLGAFECHENERVALFAVLGGSFAEGIDLPGERLQNVIVVSTGMPQPDSAVRAMQRYYDGLGQDGFFMAMTLPGMIRVIQAAGRLIRTEADMGSLLLIDSRFNHVRVRSLLAGTLAGDALGIR